jgi:hypothetical protein
MISQILYNIHPTQYETTVALIKSDLIRGNEVSLLNVKDDIRQVYGSIKQSNTQDKSDTLLVHGNKSHFKKQFKQGCRICGKKGHKGNDCWSLDKNRDKRPNQFNTPYAANIACYPYTGPPCCDYCKMKNQPADKYFMKKDEQQTSSSNTTTKRAEVMMICASCQDIEILMANKDGNRELSKVCDGATRAQWKALLRCIKYVLDTKNKALKMNPKQTDNMFTLEGI